MAEATTPEPSIEEILASIRKIISDDDEPAEAEPDMHKPEPAKMSEEMDAWPESNDEEEVEKLDEADDDVLELTEIAAEPAAVERHHYPEPEPIIPPVMHKPEPQDDSSIVSDRAMAAATGAFAKLSHVDEPATVSHDSRTIEEITRELLKPMLRQWIDQNLPQIVERLVEKELRKISRKAEDL